MDLAYLISLIANTHVREQEYNKRLRKNIEENVRYNQKMQDFEYFWKKSSVDNVIDTYV